MAMNNWECRPLAVFFHWTCKMQLSVIHFPRWRLTLLQLTSLSVSRVFEVSLRKCLMYVGLTCKCFTLLPRHQSRVAEYTTFLCSVHKMCKLFTLSASLYCNVNVHISLRGSSAEIVFDWLRWPAGPVFCLSPTLL